jgi:predicted naringenin-chalcone synthase
VANIISIQTAVPDYCHQQQDILNFMQKAYHLDSVEARKLSYLYRHSNIDQRFSVIEDFGNADGSWQFISENGHEPPSLEERMQLYARHALPLSLAATNRCLDGLIEASQLTHLITVSCTGMSAPGLDLQIAEAMQLSPNIFRTSVNFMGCYAAIHALKMAKMICDSTPSSNVLIVCTELCTIHFQKKYTQDNAASSLLFADGCAAVVVSNIKHSSNALSLNHFYSEVSYKGKADMTWELGKYGFLMTLSAFIPQLIQEDIALLVQNALQKNKIDHKDISHWCIHPGGKKILDVIQSQLQLADEDLQYSRKVLSEYGNMSSPTILFVLKEILEASGSNPVNVFGVAFGPGLTMETFIASRP